jgi:hypothetical protein
MLGGRHEAGALQSLSTESGHYRSADQISRSGHSSRLLRIRSLPVDPQVTKGRQAISTKAFEAGATIAPRPLQSAQPRSLEWSRASLREVVSGAAGNSGKAICADDGRRNCSSHTALRAAVAVRTA